jgi:hypothetical protein
VYCLRTAVHTLQLQQHQARGWFGIAWDLLDALCGSRNGDGTDVEVGYNFERETLTHLCVV